MNIDEENGSITFSVRVVPRSSRSEIVGELNGAVKVKLSAPPVEGAANVELIKLFAKLLAVPKSSIVIVSGETSRTKRLRIEGISIEQLRSILND